MVNNQIGFTTTPEEARSSEYATDVAKLAGAPIFHVNGEDPEAAVHLARLAFLFRQEIERDVVIDLLCYRRHGHNEGDEPGFTQPLLYKEIKKRPSVRKLYLDKLLQQGVIDKVKAIKLADGFKQKLEESYQQAKEEEPLPADGFDERWQGQDNPYSHKQADTKVPYQRLYEVARSLATVPKGFTLNKKIERRLSANLKTVKEKGQIDWSMGESLAFGSLLQDGVPVRLSGQDSQRGTFSQRHAVWVDTETGRRYLPLGYINDKQARFRVFNSPLAEASVLGFEYGYSMSDPGGLVMWEAQFGDFANGAQVIIDQFIVSAQSKWNRASGLVMLLPHGYEGQGPEHSNAYLERYLAACAQNNIQVVNPTTPAQYFHLLRRQMKRPFRLPLIVMTPKSLLRHPKAVSELADFENGGFLEFLDDTGSAKNVRRLVLCCGKIFYDLLQEREKQKLKNVALVRIEQLYPFNEKHFYELISAYSNLEQMVWAQEEPQNRGAYDFMKSIIAKLLPDVYLTYAGRKRSASPAVGSLKQHRIEQDQIVKEALGLNKGSEQR